MIRRLLTSIRSLFRRDPASGEGSIRVCAEYPTSDEDVVNTFARAGIDIHYPFTVVARRDAAATKEFLRTIEAVVRSSTQPLALVVVESFESDDTPPADDEIRKAADEWITSDALAKLLGVETPEQIGE